MGILWTSKKTGDKKAVKGEVIAMGRGDGGGREGKTGEG